MTDVLPATAAWNEISKKPLHNWKYEKQLVDAMRDELLAALEEAEDGRDALAAILEERDAEVERLQGEVGYCEGCGAWLGENPLLARVAELERAEHALSILRAHVDDGSETCDVCRKVIARYDAHPDAEERQ